MYFLGCFSQDVQWNRSWDVMNPCQKTWWDELMQRSVVSLREISSSVWNLWKYMKQITFHLKTLSRIHLHYQTISGFLSICCHISAHIGTWKVCAWCNWGTRTSQTMSEQNWPLSSCHLFWHLIGVVGLNQEQPSSFSVTPKMCQRISIQA